jgi:hypothetical protein
MGNQMHIDMHVSFNEHVNNTQQVHTKGPCVLCHHQPPLPVLPDAPLLFALLDVGTLLLPAAGVTGGWGGPTISRSVTGRKLATKPVRRCMHAVG